MKQSQIKNKNTIKLVPSEEQQQFIDIQIRKNLCLIACPGSGKSTSILMKINSMFEEKQIKNKNQCLILSFSRQQCEDLKQKMEEYQINGIGINNILTIHSLCGKIYNQITDRNSSKNTIVVAVNTLLKKIDQESFNIRQVPSLKMVKYIFVDEAQDLSEHQYETIMLISKRLFETTLLEKDYNKDSFWQEVNETQQMLPVIMVGDANQNIYQFQGSLNKFLLNHSDLKISLTKNCRSSNQIIDFLNHFQIHSLPMKGSGKVGSKPQLYQGQMQDICQNIIQKIKECIDKGISYDQIAIIGPSKKQQQFKQTEASNIGLQTICNLLDDNEIPYQQRYQISNSNGDVCCSDLKKGFVNILTIHGSKGLEFEAVFVIDFKFKTQNRIPTLNDYEQFKYLWFVALSRAKQHLLIYNLQKQQIWPEIYTQQIDLYETNQQLIKKPVKYEQLFENKTHTITELLEKNEFFSPETTFEFEQLIDLQISQEQVFTPPKIELNTVLSILWGQFMESVFNWCYYSHKGQKQIFITSLIEKFNQNMEIDSSLVSMFQTINKKYNLSQKLNNISIFDDIETDCELKQQLNLKNIQELVQYARSKNLKYFKAFVHSNNIHFEPALFQELLGRFANSNDTFEQFSILFHIQLYLYQIENQCAYLLKKSFEQEIKDLFEFYPSILQYITEMTDENVEVQCILQHPDIKIIGIADVISNQRVIELKFSREFNINHAIQAYLYNFLQDAIEQQQMNYNQMSQEQLTQTNRKVQVFNMFSGIIYNVNVNLNIPQIQVLMKLAEISKLKLENRIFIYDIETQGLDKYNHEILQMHMVDFNTNSTVFSSYFDFPISEEIMKLTNILPEQLTKGEKNYNSLKQMLNRISNICQNPVLIAHNGNSFDHQFLLQKNIIKYGQFALSDSKPIISQFYSQKGNLVMKLQDLHQLICHDKCEKQNSELQAHNAIYDVQMVIDMFRVLDVTSDYLQIID